MTGGRIAMSRKARPLWLAKSASQVVAQYTARRANTRAAPDRTYRDRLIRHLCLELLAAIAVRIPDEQITIALLNIIELANAATLKEIADAR